MIIGYIDSVVIEATEDFSDIRKELAALNPEAYPLLSNNRKVRGKRK